MQFRCYRNLSKVIRIINFIDIIGYLWHMGGKYLATVIPDSMQMRLGELTMCSTYMEMI